MRILTLICILSLVIWTANGAPFDLSNLGDQIRSRVNEAVARAHEAAEQARANAREAIARAKESGNYTCFANYGGSYSISARLVWTENGNICYSNHV